MKIKWLKTLYFNFKMFQFRSAIQFPVIFYGKIRFNSLKGQVLINAPIKSGMVKFGWSLEMNRTTLGISELRIDGIFKINGEIIISKDVILFILEGAILEIGEKSHFGSRSRILVTNKVILGKRFRLSYESQIMDSSFHYMLNTEKNEIQRMTGTIIINDYCWIGNRTTIMKNTITPRYITVASNSLLNKDYTKEVPEKSLIGGIPARLLKTNLLRVFEPQKEKIIQDYFDSHPDEMTFKPTDLF